MSVTYSAVLPVSEETVLFVSGLLAAERRRRCTRSKVSASTSAGTGISSQSSRGRSTTV